MDTSDLLIVGSGPAGLSAAINAASEGLKVRLLDAGTPMGGQARESAAIENYPGFPESVTGDDLMTRFVTQAKKFGTDMVAPVSAVKLEHDKDIFTVTTDDYQKFEAKSVLLSLGVSYRRLDAEGIAPLMGRGIFYGRPAGTYHPLKKREVTIVGGANSAGQAAVKLSENPHTKVRVVVRSSITDKMSTYLIDRIRSRPNVTVCEGCDVTKVMGGDCLEQAVLTYKDGHTDLVGVDQMYVFIGAIPRTYWLNECGIDLDEHHFVRTGKDAYTNPYETSLKGCFAAGDIRSGSVKRIASAIGEGAQAVPFIHQFLDR